MIEVFPEEAVKNAAHKLVAESEMTDQNPWWQTNRLIEARVKTPPSEVYRILTSDGAVDLVNFTQEVVSDEELREISETLRMAIGFTKGKILDRIIGIALLPEEAYRDPTGKNKVNGRPNTAGDLNRMNPIVNLNMDAIRNPIDDSFQPFIEKRIPGRGVTMLQQVFAHECGHAMDLTYVDEIERQAINTSRMNLAINGRTKEFTAFEDPDPSVYVLEPSLSSRARVNAAEDFAETFALAVLGADMSSVPQKMRRIEEVIAYANGQEIPDSKIIGVEKVG
jgi:hypothetical protein